LAERLARSGRPVLQASIDDFHPPGHGARSAAGGYTVESYYTEAYDYAAFRDLLLVPLGPRGDRRCRLALHDSFADTPKGQTVSVGPETIVVIDGCFIHRPDLRGYWDFTIWLDISFETMIARAVPRDVAWMPSEIAVLERYRARWIPLHMLYETSGARACADLVIDNDDHTSPRIIRQG
jgi:uridine kinase